jgi:hypothetical protein
MSAQPYAGLLERPFAYAYRYPAWPPEGATIIRLGNGGREVNGVKPIETIPLYSAEAISSLLNALREADKLICDRLSEYEDEDARIVVMGIRAALSGEALIVSQSAVRPMVHTVTSVTSKERGPTSTGEARPPFLSTDATPSGERQ